MRKVDRIPIFPWNKGLDRTSIPGLQDYASLDSVSNLILLNNGARRKAFGVEKLDYIGSHGTYLQGLAYFSATNGSSQTNAIIRVLGGRVEVLENDGEFKDISLPSVPIHPDDVVTFSRFGNALIIFSQSAQPLYYTYPQTLTTLNVFSSHQTSPPRFGSVHDYRLFYSGRGANPHVLYASAPGDINLYTLASGGFSMRIFEGDGDEVGINGISRQLKGDLYVFKYNNTYRIPRNSYGYGLDVVSNEIGTVAHDTIVQTSNDIFWVSDRGIHSLAMTAKYGASEEYTLTYPIYEYFQEDVNWNAADQMKATYDSESNTYLLNYATSSSARRDKILGFNLRNREFFEIYHDGVTYLTHYNELGRRRVLVANSEGEIGVMKGSLNTYFEEAIDVSFSSADIVPFKDLSVECTFTKVKFLLKPTEKSVKITISYDIDGERIGSFEIDSYGSGEGAIINDETDTDDGSKIGEELIKGAKKKFATRTEELKGKGSSIQFHVKHEPPETDKDQPFEMYGIIIEYEFNEDDDADSNA